MRRSANSALSGDRPGSFHEWDIAFTNRSGETEIWTISDHTMRINQDKYWIFSPERYSARQALTLELMDLSCYMAGEQVLDEILRDILPEREADCIDVYITYRNGNPPPSMYSRQRRQPWFNVDQISASEYLKTDLYDFYIRVLAYNYRVEKLSQEEQEHLFGSLAEIEKALQEAFGAYADYDIYLGEGYTAEYSGVLAR